MEQGERFEGDKAADLIGRAENVEVFFRGEGGELAAGVVDGRPCLVTGDLFAVEEGMPSSQSVTMFQTPEGLSHDLNDRGLADSIRSRGWAVHDFGDAKRDASATTTGAVLLEAARSWASSLRDRSQDLGALNESDLENGLLEEVNRHRGARKQVYLSKTSARPAALKGWPGVGPLDLEIESDDGPVWAELKWADSAGYLFNCLWDAAKLARGVREGAASAGYLVAGLPVSAWKKGSEYLKLFDFSAFAGDTIATSTPEFEVHWTRWRRESTSAYPQELACPIYTWPEGEVIVQSADGREPWSIRVARVSAPGIEAIPAPTFGIKDAHRSDSSIQREVEAYVLEQLKDELGDDSLDPGKVAIGDSHCQVDGISTSGNTVVEIYAHVGRMKGGQHKKIATDILKLATIRRQRGREQTRCLLVFVDDVARDSVTGWRLKAADEFGIEIHPTVRLPEEMLELLRGAQDDQADGMKGE